MKTNNLLLFIIFIITFFCKLIFSQSNLIWDKRFSYLDVQDHPMKIMVDNDYNIFVVGYSAITNTPQTNFDAIILKYNKFGELLWIRKHSLENFGDDIFLNLIVLDSGKVFASGSMYTGQGTRMLNILFNESGDTIWNKHFPFISNFDSHLRRISIYNNKILITDGLSNKFILVSYDIEGTNETIEYSDNLNANINDIQFMKEDSLYIFINYNRLIPPTNYYNPMVAKYNLDLEPIWETSLIDSAISLISSIFIVDSNSFTYTFFNENHYHLEKFFLAKTDKYGNKIWIETFEVTQDESIKPTAILVKGDGTIYIVGKYTLWTGSTGYDQVFFLKFDCNGNLLKFIKRDISEFVYSVNKASFDANDNLYILLTSQSTNWLTNFHLVKYNSSDEFEYEVMYDYQNLGTHNEEPIDFWITSENDFIITGRCSAPSSTTKILTTKFSDEPSFVNTEQMLAGSQLSQNYPNPFNPTTKISWQSPVASHQTLKVYDVLGNEVATLVNEYKPAGVYNVQFTMNNLSSGVYFYKLQAGSFVETKKMILIK